MFVNYLERQLKLENGKPNSYYEGDYLQSPFVGIVPRVISTLSIASYAVILFLIFRSAAKASTVYHRIMVMISVAGIGSCISTGLGTWVMPKYGPENVKGDPFNMPSWPEPRYGNEATCAAQGVLKIFGDRCINMSIVMLCF